VWREGRVVRRWWMVVEKRGKKLWGKVVVRGVWGERVGRKGERRGEGGRGEVGCVGDWILAWVAYLLTRKTDAGEVKEC